MSLFCNNLLTNFTVWASAAPLLCSCQRVDIHADAAGMGSGNRQAYCPPCSGPVAALMQSSSSLPGLAAVATTAASAATDTVITTGLGPGPAQDAQPTTWLTHCPLWQQTWSHAFHTAHTHMLHCSIRNSSTELKFWDKWLRIHHSNSRALN